MSKVRLWVDDRGLIGTQAPQSRAVTCFSEETKWSRCATYMALGSGCEQYTALTPHHFPRNRYTCVEIDGWDLLALELPHSLFKHFNPCAPTTVSSLSLIEPLLSFLRRKMLSSLSFEIQAFELQYSKGMIFISQLPCHLQFYCLQHDYTFLWLFMISTFLCAFISTVHASGLYFLGFFWWCWVAPPSSSKVSSFLFLLAFSSI